MREGVRGEFCHRAATASPNLSRFGVRPKEAWDIFRFRSVSGSSWIVAENFMKNRLKRNNFKTGLFQMTKGSARYLYRNPLNPDRFYWVQSGLEFRTFEYRIHSITERFKSRYSNDPTIQKPNFLPFKFRTSLNGVRFSNGPDHSKSEHSKWPP